LVLSQFDDGDKQMKAAIIESSFGMLAFSEEHKLIEKVLFPQKPQKAAKALVKIEAGKVVDENLSI